MTRILLAFLGFYQRWISPALHGLGGGGGCRFVPTCSEYAAIAIGTHGPVRGTGLAIWRLMRCHPFCRGGLDPVPITSSSRNRVSGNLLPTTRKRKKASGQSPATTHQPHKPLP